MNCLFIATLMIIVSLSLDDLSAGNAYGLQNSFIPFQSIGIITLGSSISTYLTMNLGQLGRIIFSPTIATYISGLLLTGLAICYLYHAINNSQFTSRNKYYTYLHWHQMINYWDIFNRGIEIPFTDFVSAFALSLAGAPVFLTSLLWKVSEITMLFIGIQLGKKGFTKTANRKLEIWPGLFLLSAGFIRLFLKLP